MKILIVEDDTMLARAVQQGMACNGWQVDHAASAGAARAMLVDHAYALVLLDLQLPGASGTTVLRAMRERFDDTPVLILTARDRITDRVAGLDAGADDYLVKPFDSDELHARIRALHRRHARRVTGVMRVDDVVVDPARREVRKAGAAVALSQLEYKTLLALMSKAGTAVRREHLEAMVYDGEASIESNTVAVFIHQLRRKLGEQLITTVYGVGYRIGEASA